MNTTRRAFLATISASIAALALPRVALAENLPVGYWNDGHTKNGIEVICDPASTDCRCWSVVAWEDGKMIACRAVVISNRRRLNEEQIMSVVRDEVKSVYEEYEWLKAHPAKGVTYTSTYYV